MELNKTYLLRYLLFLINATLIILTSGCTKLDVTKTNDSDLLSPNKFFDNPFPVSPQVQRVIEEFFKRDQATKLATSFSKKYGQPLWKKGFVVEPKYKQIARSQNERIDTVVIIPVVQPNIQKVQTYIEAHLSGTIELNIYTSSEYRMLRFSNTDTLANEAEKLAIRFMLLNKDVFNHQSFAIRDKRLFHNSANYADTADIYRKVALHESEASAKLTPVTLCVEVVTTTISYHCTRTGSCMSGVCDNCYRCVTTSTSTNITCESWWEDDGGGGGSGGDGDTGGGGGTGGGGSDPCTGSGPVGKGLPCGDPGDDGWDPIPMEEDPNDDPCTTAQNKAKQMDSIFMKANADSVLATIPNLATETKEKGFAMIKKLQINPFNSTDTSLSGYHSSLVSTGTDSNIVISYSTGSLEYTAATLHTHPPKGYAPHSARDIYAFLENRIGEEAHFIGTFVAASTGDKYAITITDPTRASSFLSTKNQYLNGTKWNEDTDIGKAFKKAMQYYEDKYKDNPNSTHLAYEMAMAAVLKHFGTGITLNKKDATGKFKPIIVKMTPNPRKPKKIDYTQECL